MNPNDVTTEVQVKTSSLCHVDRVWLPMTIALLAVAGLVGTVGVTIVATVILRTTTTSI